MNQARRCMAKDQQVTTTTFTVAYVIYLIIYAQISVIDYWKQYMPEPVEIKSDSVYDHYDILEEIGV